MNPPPRPGDASLGPGAPVGSVTGVVDDRSGNAQADRAADRHKDHAQRPSPPPRRPHRRGADDHPARRRRGVDDDAHARTRLRARRRVLPHRRSARRRARSWVCATAPTTPLPRPRSTRSPSRPAASRRNRCLGSGTVSSSCGWCGSDQIEVLVERLTPLPPSAPIPPAVLAGVPDRVLGGQGLFTKTGAVHAAAAFDRDGEVLLTREDVGRHNAVDKVVGALLLAGRTSGRRPWAVRQWAGVGGDGAEGVGGRIRIARRGERTDRARRPRRPPRRARPRRLRPRRFVQPVRLSTSRSVRRNRPERADSTGQNVT